MHTYSTLGLLNADGDGFWTIADFGIIRQSPLTSPAAQVHRA
jgi:hypothetical protein